MLNSQPEKKLKSTILAENVKLWDSLSPAQLYLPEATTLIRFASAWWKQKKNVFCHSPCLLEVYKEWQVEEDFPRHRFQKVNTFFWNQSNLIPKQKCSPANFNGLQFRDNRIADHLCFYGFWCECLFPFQQTTQRHTAISQPTQSDNIHFVPVFVFEIT